MQKCRSERKRKYLVLPPTHLINPPSNPMIGHLFAKLSASLLRMGLLKRCPDPHNVICILREPKVDAKHNRFGGRFCNKGKQP